MWHATCLSLSCMHTHHRRNMHPHWWCWRTDLVSVQTGTASARQEQYSNGYIVTHCIYSFIYLYIQYYISITYRRGHVLHNTWSANEKEGKGESRGTFVSPLSSSRRLWGPVRDARQSHLEFCSLLQSCHHSYQQEHTGGSSFHNTECIYTVYVAVCKLVIPWHCLLHSHSHQHSSDHTQQLANDLDKPNLQCIVCYIYRVLYDYRCKHDALVYCSCSKSLVHKWSSTTD